MNSSQQHSKQHFGPWTFRRSQAGESRGDGTTRITEQKIPERCPECGGSKLARRGRRKNKLQTLQLWRCAACRLVFTSELGVGKQYPVRVILDALCWYCQGYDIREVLSRIKRRYGYEPHENTIWNWLSEFSYLCTYRRLRMKGRHKFLPTQLIRKVKLFHRQVYEFAIHRGKLTGDSGR